MTISHQTLQYTANSHEIFSELFKTLHIIMVYKTTLPPPTTD